MMRQQVCFEDVVDGQQIPGLKMSLDVSRFYLQASGTQVFASVHCDDEFAQRQGLSHIFLNRNLLEAAFSRVVIQWMGDAGWLQRFEIQIRKMNFLGDSISVQGKVVRKYVQEEHGCVDCELWITNQGGETTTLGKATVTLPFHHEIAPTSSNRPGGPCDVKKVRP